MRALYCIWGKKGLICIYGFGSAELFKYSDDECPKSVVEKKLNISPRQTRNMNIMSVIVAVAAVWWEHESSHQSENYFRTELFSKILTKIPIL